MNEWRKETTTTESYDYTEEILKLLLLLAVSSIDTDKASRTSPNTKVVVWASNDFPKVCKTA